MKTLLKLVCKDICAVNTLMIADSGMVVVVVFLVLVTSYISYYIISGHAPLQGDALSQPVALK